MPSGGHRHCKRLAAPKSWGLEKTGGTFAVRMLPGAHNKTLCVPLKYILTRYLKLKVCYILSNKMVVVNGKEVVRSKAAVGLFDVITVKKTNTHYRLLFNINRRFVAHEISSAEAQYRLTKVMAKSSEEGVPFTRTLDGYNFRFVDPVVTVSSTVKVDIKTNKIVDHTKFEADKFVFVFGGSNMGRIGVVKRLESLRDGKVFVYLTDRNGKDFTVLQSKAIVVGDKNGLWVSFDKDAGVKLDEYELSNIKYAAADKVPEEVDVTAN